MFFKFISEMSRLCFLRWSQICCIITLTRNGHWKCALPLPYFFFQNRVGCNILIFHWKINSKWKREVFHLTTFLKFKKNVLKFISEISRLCLMGNKSYPWLHTCGMDIERCALSLPRLFFANHVGCNIFVFHWKINSKLERDFFINIFLIQKKKKNRSILFFKSWKQKFSLKK